MHFIIAQIIQPLIRRLGTTISAFLIGIGAATETVTIITAGFVALAGLLVDLGVSYATNRINK